MNAPFSVSPPATVSADGQVRRAFTVADVERMVEVGIIGHDERLEIVAGEIIPMSPKGNRHEILKQHLNRHFGRRLPDAYTYIQEAGWHLGETLYLEPDFLFFPAATPLAAVKGADALLVVEVSDSSLGWDLGRKPVLYGGEGVAEYWVIDAVDRTTHIHRLPSAGGYGSIRSYAADVTLPPDRLPGLTIRLADLPTI